MFTSKQLIHVRDVIHRRRNESGLRPWARGVAGALAILLGTASAAILAGEPPGSSEKPDFTNLSLEELLKAEITPIDVLGSHTHLAREIMFGYRYSYQRYEGNLEGSREVSAAGVLAKYDLYHPWMDMHMQMFEAMYAPSDRWTLMGMTHYMDMHMGHLRRNGTTFVSASEGIGDTEVMGLYNLLGDPRGKGHRLILDGGISLPTGSINKKFAGKQLEYSMQLGSGTLDVLPGLTYLGSSDRWSWAVQAGGTIHTGQNDRGYRLGDRYQLGAWGHYKLTEWLGPSLRLEWKQWGNISGADAALDPMHNPAFDVTLQEGRRLDLLAGLHFYAHRGPLKGLRFSTEGGMSVYQHLAGPNLKSDWMINLSLNYVLR